jgi:hypothetical protein
VSLIKMTAPLTTSKCTKVYISMIDHTDVINVATFLNIRKYYKESNISHMEDNLRFINVKVVEKQRKISYEES